jgi:predicted nucleic acid-binding protein
VPSRRIVNASPLILLSKTGQLEFLQLGDVAVVVPEAVVVEVEAKGHDDPVALAIRETTWITIEPSPATPGAVLACNIDAGESAVLALALGDGSCEVVLDDKAGRNCARRLGIPCLGTLGLVVLARRLGAIPMARPVIDRLREVGLYLSDEYVREVLDRLGES